jgi:hypothetical protein
LAVLLLVSAACVPFFAGGPDLVVTETDNELLVAWPGALDIDPDDTIESYEIRVDAAVVRTLDAAHNYCALTGLVSGTDHLIEVVAVGTDGSSSDAITGEFANWGVLSLSHTAYTVGIGGDLDCSPLADTDGDRLPDAVETNTGVFDGLHHTGTDPTTEDTDNDGLLDGDEVLRRLDGLHLADFGVSPLHRDVLVEFDWFDDTSECGAHSHRPTEAALAMVGAAFAAAPVENPDGTTGINFIADYGQGGVFTGGTLVDDADGVIAGNVFGPEYRAIRSANFAPERRGVFHYSLMLHRYDTTSNSSGYAEFLGDDLLVSLQCVASADNLVANTVLHELGHNFNLRHGGDFDLPNFKPNYNSVMNYLYQFTGIDTDCDGVGDGILDFSHGTNADLDEANLDESVGICDGVPIDWNGDGEITAGVSRDLTFDTLLTTIDDNDDWASALLWAVRFGADNDARRGRAPETGVAERPIPADVLEQFGGEGLAVRG